jgi:hypothetical protein
MDSVVAFMEKKAGSIPPEAKARVLSNDPQALLAVVNGLGEWPSAMDILPTMTLTCLA